MPDSTAVPHLDITSRSSGLLAGGCNLAGDRDAHSELFRVYGACARVAGGWCLFWSNWFGECWGARTHRLMGLVPGCVLMRAGALGLLVCPSTPSQHLERPSIAADAHPALAPCCCIQYLLEKAHGRD